MQQLTQQDGFIYFLKMNVDVNFLKMWEFADQSAAAGKPIVDDDLILHILGGFGADFDAVVVNIANRPYNLNLQEVQFAFQEHEVRMQNLVKETTMIVLSIVVVILEKAVVEGVWLYVSCVETWPCGFEVFQKIQCTLH